MASQSLAQDLFEDMSRKVADASREGGGEDGDAKVVDEIESLCMNCHGDVCLSSLRIQPKNYKS